MGTRPKLLGIAASLRNARWGMGNRDLIDSLRGIANDEQLFTFLSKESELHLENFIEAGRKNGKSFLEIYDNLKRNKGNKGLSNSEVALASALWSALRYDVDIEHISLSEYFLASGAVRNEEVLKDKLLEADGLLVSGPVYFGDRSSLVQSLVEMIRRDTELCKRLQGKLFGGIAVGAKRNGGQETTLIYQMLDFVNVGYLAVGNDSDTTAQYGGTGHAGDIGTMHKDSYGLRTSMGTGRRIASLMRELGPQRNIKGPVKVLFVVLQDRQGEAHQRLKKMLSAFAGELQATIVNAAEERIFPCIACDICPTHVDTDEVYRCIITSKHDSLRQLHNKLLHHDAIVPVMFSTKNAHMLNSSYQTFMERTRYLRRGDYALSNQLVAPLVFEEVGASQNYALRAMTSMMRHHTVIAQPMIGYIHGGEVLNGIEMEAQMKQFFASARRLAAARLAEVYENKNIKYNPVGYVLAANKETEDIRLNSRKEMVKSRYEHLLDEAKERLLPVP
jgi:multimeric flavodoxin WrbA